MSIQDRLNRGVVPEIPESNMKKVAVLPSSGDLEGELTLGLIVNGERHQRIVVSKMYGEAKAQVFRKEVRRNPAKGITRLIAKLVKQIGPYSRIEFEKKKDEVGWLNIIRRLTVPCTEEIFLLMAKASKKKPIKRDVVCDSCEEKFEISISPNDIEILEPEGEIEITSSGRFVIKLENEDPYLDARIMIPNRHDSEMISGMKEKNEMKLVSGLWNRCILEVNGVTKDENDPYADVYLGLDDDVAEEFALSWDISMPGPQSVYFMECP